MRNVIIWLLCAALFVSAGCGASDAPLTADSDVILGPGIQLGQGTELAEDPFAEGDRSVSAAFGKLFLDSVNHQSMGRWTLANNGGSKEWTLSNTAYSAPKAWLLGGNYWRAEDDTLTSNSFLVPGGLQRLKVSFYSRWQLGSGDRAGLEFSGDNGAHWDEVIMFTGAGQNADYAGWTKYLLLLPESDSDRTCQIRFSLHSDTADNGFGFAVDNVAVYQTLPLGPTGVAASDDYYLDRVKLTWGAPPQGGQTGYVIRRAESAPGPYTTLETVANDATSYLDMTAEPGGHYVYQVTASLPGFISSAPGIDTGSVYPQQAPPKVPIVPFTFYGVDNDSEFWIQIYLNTMPIADSFNLQEQQSDSSWADAQGFFVHTNNDPEGFVSYWDVQKDDNGLHTYRVRYGNQYGWGEWSDPFQARDLGDDPL